tara:strand:- start:287 stop:496 length:210 start_codon:yes stop_codon:yes gene_type:complete
MSEVLIKLDGVTIGIADKNAYDKHDIVSLFQKCMHKLDILDETETIEIGFHGKYTQSTPDKHRAILDGM